MFDLAVIGSHTRRIELLWTIVEIFLRENPFFQRRCVDISSRDPKRLVYTKD